MLTNILVERTFGLTIKSYKVYKEISQSANLPDNMTPEELAFNILSKTTAKTYHETRESYGINALHKDVIDAGDTMRAARELVEERTGVSIVSEKNAKDLRKLPSKKRKELSLRERTLFDQ
jgi:DNA-damage-inducible protein D